MSDRNGTTAPGIERTRTPRLQRSLPGWRRALPALACALLAVLLTAADARAQTWSGAIDNDWTKGGNWVGGVAPAAGGSALINTDTPNTVIGVSPGVNVDVTNITLGQAAPNIGDLTVQNGATVTVANKLSVGQSGTGTLLITGGSVLTTSGPILYIGENVGSNGTVTVSGPGSHLIANQTLNVGFDGTGTLNIENNGVVTVNGNIGINVPRNTGSGTLNVNTGGVLETNLLINAGFGIGQVTFDNGTLRALNDNANFIQGFTGTAFNIAAGGMTLDTKGFFIGTDSVLSGVGAITKVGLGDVTFLANNTFSGGLNVNEGSVTAGIAGTAFGTGLLRVAAGATADLANFDTTVGGLFGAGDVTLGTATLTVDQAVNTTFSGVISGKGGSLVKDGAGTLTLTGTNTYTGGTTISAGTLQLGDGGATGSIVGDVLNSGTLIFNRSNEYDFTGQISGNGAVEQNGSGTTIFNTAQIYTGPTTINAGALVVNSTLESAVTVNAAGTLGGVGTINNDVTNAGTLAPGFGLTAPGAKMTIKGDYTGVGPTGTLAINAFLGDNTNSVTDQLIVNNGSMKGTTGIVVSSDPLSPGGDTTGNGIPIVVATGTTTTTTDAFKLGKDPTGGTTVYALQRGQTGTAQELASWYLCATTDCLNNGAQTGPGGPFTQQGPGPVLPPGQPLYHGGTPMQSLYGTMARQLGLLTLGTFHERNGDQRLADTGGRERTWARLFGEHMEQSHAGTVRPSFEGDFVGLQGGADLWQFASLPGHRDNVGMFAAYTEGRAHVSGLVYGMDGLFAGSTDFNATSLGAYWSHIAPAGGWYTDAVLMGTLYDGDGRTRHATDVGVEGSGVIASLEGGFTLARFMGLKLEPQAQLVYQYVNLDEAHHNNSGVDHHTPDALHGRIGLRLAADQLPWLLRPYLKANIWQDFVGADRTTWGGGADELVIRHRATVLELGGGFTAQIAPNVALWASADWSTDIAGNEQERESVSGNAGLRIVW